MDEQFARLIVIGMTAVGAVAWMGALAVTLRAHGQRPPKGLGEDLPFEIDNAPAISAIAGSAEIAGQPQELAAKLTEQLARVGVMPIGLIKILKSDRDEVVFEPAGPNSFFSVGFGRGRFRFRGIGPRTHIDYAVETTARRFLTTLSWVFVALGLAVLVVVPWFQFQYVVPSPNPSVRAQSLQTVQIIHFLWPPFLFAFVARQPAKILRTQIGALLHNLPYS
jgi:hypothetical protein